MPRYGSHTPSSSVPLESQEYTASYRAVASDGAVKVYNGAGRIDVARAMSFDVMDPAFSSADLLAAALLSEVLLVCTAAFAAQGEQLMDLEGRARVTTSDPLVVAGARGVKGQPRITGVVLDVYLFTFLDQDEANEVIGQALQRAVLCQSLQAAFPIKLAFSLAE